MKNLDKSKSSRYVQLNVYLLASQCGRRSAYGSCRRLPPRTGQRTGHRQPLQQVQHAVLNSFLFINFNFFPHPFTILRDPKFAHDILV